MSMITGPDIDRFRLRVIASALRLESKGMKGKIKASVIARKILTEAGKKPAKLLGELYVQFKNFIDESDMEVVQ